MIPVFEPQLGEEEVTAAAEAVRKGEISGSFGDLIPQFEREFAEFCGTKYAVACTSGTTALHLAVSAAGIGPGDEVLVSASTNIATALAVFHNGAVPVPVDSEPETWNLDLGLVESLISKNTKAIIPVHLFGHPVDMDALSEVAERRGLLVIEDCAEAHGAQVRGRCVGSFGQMSCFSFYANKIITTGEGGMITTDDRDLAERLRLLRNLGFTQPRFRHDVAGYNFRMTGIQAAIGIVQLRKISAIIEAKRALAASYNEELQGISALSRPIERDWARHVYWMYAVRVRPGNGVTRDQLAQSLRDRGIDSRTFFCPMSLQPCFSGLERCSGIKTPVADEMWRDGLYLPSGTNLTRDDIAHIGSEVRAIFETASR